MPAVYPDRVITIKGTIDNMSAAEAAITAKLRECHEKEMLPLVGCHILCLLHYSQKTSFANWQCFL